MPSVESSSGSERSCCSKSSSSLRDRRRMRLLKWKWIHEQQHSQPASHGGELSFSAFRRARRSSRRSRMTKEEYLRLKQMVPAVATQVRVSKVQVIEEAIKYIDSLHAALFQRLRAQRGITTGSMAPSSPSGEAAGSTEFMQEADQSALVKQWIGRLLQPVMSSNSSSTTSSSVAVSAHRQHPRERIKSWPSFLDKVDRMVRTKKHS